MAPAPSFEAADAGPGWWGWALLLFIHKGRSIYIRGRGRSRCSERVARPTCGWRVRVVPPPRAAAVRRLWRHRRVPRSPNSRRRCCGGPCLSLTGQAEGFPADSLRVCVCRCCCCCCCCCCCLLVCQRLTPRLPVRERAGDGAHRSAGRHCSAGWHCGAGEAAGQQRRSLLLGYWRRVGISGWDRGCVIAAIGSLRLRWGHHSRSHAGLERGAARVTAAGEAAHPASGGDGGGPGRCCGGGGGGLRGGCGGRHNGAPCVLEAASLCDGACSFGGNSAGSQRAP